MIHHFRAAMESRAAMIALGMLIVALGTALALAFRPVPHSDWAYYWAAAGDVARYERGGLGLWLLAGPKAAGLSPIACALVLNSLAVAVMLGVAHASDTTKGHLLAWLVGGYLLFLAPYLGIVQLDMVAAGFMAMGAWLVVVPPSAWPRKASLMAALLMFTAGVSTKPQFALIAWAMTGLFVVAWWLLRRRTNKTATLLMTILFAGSVSGFAVDLGLRKASGRTESMRTSSAVTLYGGLLTSNTDSARCGYWSVEAAQAAKADMDRPLHVAVKDRLAEKPARHWLSVMRCKLPGIVHPGPYAMYWLAVGGDQQRTPQAERTYQRAVFVEQRAYGLLTWAILLAAVVTAVYLVRKRDPLAAWLVASWVFAFWGVHLVFEIQGRYFLGLYLLLPLLCALMLRAHQTPRGGRVGELPVTQSNDSKGEF